MAVLDEISLCECKSIRTCNFVCLIIRCFVTNCKYPLIEFDRCLTYDPQTARFTCAAPLADEEAEKYTAYKQSDCSRVIRAASIKSDVHCHICGLQGYLKVTNMTHDIVQYLRSQLRAFETTKMIANIAETTCREYIDSKIQRERNLGCACRPSDALKRKDKSVPKTTQTVADVFLFFLERSKDRAMSSGIVEAIENSHRSVYLAHKQQKQLSAALSAAIVSVSHTPTPVAPQPANATRTQAVILTPGPQSGMSFSQDENELSLNGGDEEMKLSRRQRKRNNLVRAALAEALKEQGLENFTCIN